MSLFSSAGQANYLPVTDAEAAARWYKEKFGLRRVDIEMDNGEGCIAMGFERDDYALTVGPPRDMGDPEESVARLFTSNAKKAREHLAARGVEVGEIEQDTQGTHYFQLRDLDGNPIEVAEEP